MVHYKSNELEFILIKGKSDFDITDENKLFDSLVSKKIQELPNNLIVDFLNYQFKNTSFPYAFTSIIYNYGRNNIWLPDEEKRNIVKEWVSSLIPFHISELGVLFDVFLQFGSKPFDIKPISKLLENKKDVDKIQLLEMGLKLSNEGVGIHRKYCKSTNCATELDYIKKVDFAEQIIFNSKPKEDSIKLNKILWKGTQKQLAELFVELKKNGWIESFEYDTIKACYTNSNTIKQVLKPSLDTSTGHNNFEGIYTATYQPMFHGISKNKKSSK